MSAQRAPMSTLGAVHGTRTWWVVFCVLKGLTSPGMVVDTTLADAMGALAKSAAAARLHAAAACADHGELVAIASVFVAGTQRHNVRGALDWIGNEATEDTRDCIVRSCAVLRNTSDEYDVTPDLGTDSDHPAHLTTNAAGAS